ncbi:MAG: serine hydrolase domain-containing protein [Chryseolinea sp.]
MKIKHPLLIGLIVIGVPILVGQLMSSKRKSTEPLATVRQSEVQVPVNPQFKELLKQYEYRIRQLALEAGTPGAAIAVVHDSSIIYLKGFGLREVGERDSVDERTVFRIASVSKCFASFLTGILVEENVLHWNDSIRDILPSFALESREETDKLTIRNVLSHTTGLPYHTYTNMVEEGMPLDTMLSWLKKVRMASKVGQSYSYQNVAYSLIGEVVQARTSKTYETEMKEKVFGPLRMQTASIDYATLMANKNIAYPHKRARGRWVPAKITNTYYNVAPAGGVNASISDMAQWMIALLGNRPEVISKETLKTLFSPVVKARSKNRNYGRVHKLTSSYYGLGWRILYYPNDTLIYHGGFVNGYRSEVAVNPKEGIAVCILANAPGDLADNGIPLFFDMYESMKAGIRAWDDAERKKVAKKVAP